MPTAFVTGANGFVGANLVRDLLENGWNVRALVRDQPGATLGGLQVDVVRGDLFAPDLAGAMRGCDGVFHVAAHYSLWRRDRDVILRSNVEGTRAVLRAAKEARVGRVVHTSSVAAIGVRHGAIADETHQSALEDLVGTYKQSKLLAEREATRAAAEGLDVVVVNPSTPIGPWDAKPTPTGEVIVRFLRGGMPAYVNTGLNLIDVRDVAAGHRLAYERGRRGERYILGNENLPLKELLERLAALTGRPAPRLRLPLAIPLAVAAIDELLLGRLGRRPQIAFDGVRMAKEQMFYDSSKAIRELGLPQSPVRQALADAVAWFTANGLLTAPR
jgi:dihydroflavonol-4-reductase